MTPVILEFRKGGNYPPEEQAGYYHKTAITKAWRIPGPFAVNTSEGRLVCEDGYLCLDSRGYPYPVAKLEFDTIYEPMTE